MEKELLILGAGSSASYGYPTGEELLHLIFHFFTDSNFRETFDRLKAKNPKALSILASYHRSLANEYPQYLHGLKNIAQKLLDSASPSIDTFLAKRTDNSEINLGKFLITLVIISFEQSDDSKRIKDDDWISHFFNRRVSRRLSNFKSSLPAIISFNYDRLFERKLRMHLEKEHNTTKDTVESIVNALQIKHVYGSLPNSFTNTVVSAPHWIPTLESTSQEIRVISEERNNEDHLASIHHLIDMATRIYFLGYGFDPYNNKILFNDEKKFSEVLKTKKCFSTGYGLPNSLPLRLNKMVKDNPGWSIDFIDSVDVIYRDFKCKQLLIEEAIPHPLFPEVE